MRVAMNLARETVLALQEIKRLVYEDPNISVTNGYVVGVAYKRLQPRLQSKRIDWEKVSKSVIPNVTNNRENKTTQGVNTTMNIEASILEGINKLQNEFLSIFNATRIHKSFAVKLVLFAAILDFNNMLD